MKFWGSLPVLAVAIAVIGAPRFGLAQTETPSAEPETQPAELKAETPKPPKPKPKPKPKAKSEPPRAASTPAAAPVPTSGPPPAAAPVVLTNPPLPVVQARQLGLDKCAPMLDSMSRESLTTKYDIQSAWSTAAPANHVFQSVAVLSKPGNVPPDGLAALIAAPLGSGGCDGVIVQIFPLAGDCAEAQKVLLAGGGKTIGALLDGRILLDSAQRRLFLIPGYGNSCIAVAVDSRFAPQ